MLQHISVFQCVGQWMRRVRQATVCERIAGKQVREFIRLAGQRHGPDQRWGHGQREREYKNDCFGE